MLSSLVLQVPVGVGREIQQLTNSEFFVYLIPFLLTFALVYGLLSHSKIPKDQQVRVVISVLFGLLVLPFAPLMTGFLTPLTSSLLILVGGLLMLIILLELLGLSGEISGKQVVEKDGKKSIEKYVHKGPIFTRHANAFGLVLISIALLVFFNAGGLELLGIDTPQIFLNAPLLFFLVVVFLVVYFVALKD